MQAPDAREASGPGDPSVWQAGTGPRHIPQRVCAAGRGRAWRAAAQRACARRAGPCKALVKPEALEQHVSQWLLDLKTAAERA